MNFWACRICHLKRIALAVLIIILFVGTLDLFISGHSWYIIYFRSFIFTTACSFFCTLLVCSFIKRIYEYPRPIYYLLFSGLVFLGIFTGVVTGNLILEKRLSLRMDILIFSLLFGLISSIIITAYMFLRENLENKISRLKEIEFENERLKRYELQARYNSLQAKLNPHFLFNALNSTAALIYDDPKRAEKSIEWLSDMYRKVLSISNQTFVSISEEIELIKDFLELEKLRFDNQLTYCINCPEELKNTKIPGLLIEPLVENSTKYCQKYPGNAPTIEVNINIKGEDLFIEVKDNGPGFDVEKTSFGFGLYSVQERLQLLFGEDYRFDIKSIEGKGTRVMIRIPNKMEKKNK